MFKIVPFVVLEQIPVQYVIQDLTFGLILEKMLLNLLKEEIWFVKLVKVDV